jgi:hypothetical protein
MVGSDKFLGGDQGRDQRRVHSAKHGQVPRGGEEAGGPGDGLEGRALVIAVTAIALPAADRQHELDAEFVRHARQREAIGPAAGPTLRHHRHGAPRGAIGTEQAELQPVAASHLGALAL